MPSSHSNRIRLLQRNRLKLKSNGRGDVSLGGDLNTWKLIISVVRQLRLLYLQLYKSELPAVRPDEELAYLAITRPEIDQVIEPELVATSSPEPMATIPTTEIPEIAEIDLDLADSATPALIPSLPSSASSPDQSSHDRSSGSVLGKRASEDRDDSAVDLGERSRHRGDSVLSTEGTEVPDQGTDTDLDDDFDVVPREDPEQSPTEKRLSQLELKSPVEETIDPMLTFDPPPGSPPAALPPPSLARKQTSKDHLSSGLKFGLQQDSAEVLINVLNQLELALDSPSPNGTAETKEANLVQK